MHCDKTKEKSVQIFIPSERSFSLVFWEEEWWMAATPFIWNFGSTGPRWSEIVDLEPIMARSASAVPPSEKVQLTLIGSPLSRFPTSLRWSSYVAPKYPPKGGSKTQNGRFFSIIALRLKKVCYKVSLCENCQQQCCRAFIGLTIHAKIIGGGRPLLPFWSKWRRWSEIADFRSIFVRSASAVRSSEKSSINTNTKSTTRFPMSPKWTSYVVSKPPKSGSKNAKCPKFEQ